MSSAKIAVVTGSNKGIGYAIVKGLCEKFDGHVYLTARDVGRGTAAVKKLEDLGFKPLFHQLDIEDQKSVNKFRDHIKNTHGGLDILVNNAAIAFQPGCPEPLELQAEVTININYWANLRVCDALFPLLRNNARVVNLSSSAGFLGKIPFADLRAKFSDPKLTVEGLNQLMNKFVVDVKSNVPDVKKWAGSPYATYTVSKVGFSALSIIQQRLFDKERPNRNIAVNHVHPGWVDTDLSDHKGPLTIEEGAKAPLFAALEADFKGKYVWVDCQVVDWYGETTPTPY